MNTRIRNTVFSLIINTVLVATAAAQMAGANLTPMPAGPMDQVTAAPGVSFGQYHQVLVAPVKMSYQHGWFDTVSSYKAAPDFGRVMTQAQADKILKDLSAAFDRLVPEEFARRGYNIATAPGPGVLLLEPTVSQLWISNPFNDQPDRVAVTQDSGTATFEVAMKDSQTGAQVGYSRVRMRTMLTAPRFTKSSDVFVSADWEDTFKHWAQLQAGRMDSLKGQTVAARQ